MTRVRASAVGVAVRRVDALASLALWLPRSVAPAPWSEVGAVSTGFGSPAIPWHVIACEAELQPPSTDEDRRSSRRPESAAASGTRSASVAPGASDGLPVASRRFEARGSASSKPASLATSSTATSVFSGDRGPSLEPDRLPSHDPRSPDAHRSDESGTAVPTPAGTADADRRPGPSDSVGRHLQPVPRGAATVEVADHGSSTNAPAGPATDGAEGTTALRNGRATNLERSMPPGRIDELDGRDQPYDTELPSGALGELVRRWGGRPATVQISDDVDAGDPVTIRHTAPDDALRHTAPDDALRHPTAATRATGAPPGRPRKSQDDVPAGDEYLLDALDVALTELLRRDAERHGLGGLLS